MYVCSFQVCPTKLRWTLLRADLPVQGLFVVDEAEVSGLTDESG